MALRCWTKALPHEVHAVPIIINATSLAKFHSDICFLQDHDSTRNGQSSADQSTAPGRQTPAPQGQQFTLPQTSRLRRSQAFLNAQRQQRSAGPTSGASTSGRAPEQPLGSAPEHSLPQRPGYQQRPHRQHYGNNQQQQGSGAQRQDRPWQQQQQFQQRPQQTGFGNPPSWQQSNPYDRRPPPNTNFQSNDQSPYQQAGFQRRPPAGPQGRQVPTHQQVHPEDLEEQDNAARRRKGAFGKRSTPGSSQLEESGIAPKMRNTAGKAQGPPLSLRDDEEGATAMQQEGDMEAMSLEALEKQYLTVQGVPAAWRDEIQDEEDKDDLEEARVISAFNRRRMSGDIRFEEDQLKDDIHAVQMNLDPRLDFGHGAPRMSEAAPPNADQVLQHAKWPLCQMLEIENEDEWQELTEGMADSLEHMHQLVHQQYVKPKILEESLQAYVSQAVPKDHPMYPVVSQSLQMLLHNPNWDYQKKCAYMERLISDLV